MKLKKLPIGIQTFSKIREDDFVYVDKTGIAYDLIENYQYVFLSRPRRFGKSLFLDTLRNIFEGKKEYFAGLEIEDKWNWDRKHPVIHIAFSDGTYRNLDELTDKFEQNIDLNSERLGVKCRYDSRDLRSFGDLIQKTYEKYQEKVVVLIDEYDKPILDNITNPELAKDIREVLSGIYGAIKTNDELIQFAFITGVSKFAKTSIFSGLNNIEDISLNVEFGDICGYSQNDLETVFKEHLAGADMEMVKEWYNGYNFLGSPMYNPFDLLQFIRNNFMFKNYWFETGTPTFLIKLIEKNRYFLPNLSDLKVDEKLLSSFDINNLDLEIILYQTGYLTIDKVMQTPFGTLEYLLKIPNKEVRLSFGDYIINYLLKDREYLPKKTIIYKSLLSNNMEDFKNSLVSIFAKIPYNNYSNNYIHTYEGFYASVVFIYLQSLGLHIIGEDVTNRGRIDLTIIMPQAIFIIEFKVDGKNALEQIKENNYAQKYLQEKKDIYLVGIEFDSKEKNISNFEWEKI
ncbi:ATP-binding protein [Arcobacter vandammei]|uniref:ATP-binding protein n=1 Tax=Arcobacter vandammei TaxID=2782243 RepID=UPI0018DFA5BC|nr:ATP-binding protein [Arcobacter vandammei]